MPIDPSSMTSWRNRFGDAGAEQMLRATIEAGLKMSVIRPAVLKRINVDKTAEIQAGALATPSGETFSLWPGSVSQVV